MKVSRVEQCQHGVAPPFSKASRDRSFVDVQAFQSGTYAPVSVDGEEDALQLAGAIRTLIPGGETAQETVDRHVGPDAQHRLGGAGHAKIGDKPQAVGKDLGIGGGNVGVGAPHGSDVQTEAVQMVSHGALFAGGLGVKVHHRHVHISVSDEPGARVKGLSKLASISVRPIRFITPIRTPPGP